MAQMTWSSTSYTHDAFAAEQLTPEKLIPGGSRLVVAEFARNSAVKVTLAPGAVTAGTGKTLTVATALAGDIPPGTVLDFGSGEFATLTAGATTGTTSITGVTLAADLEGGETATYAGADPQKTIAAGTLVGRTRAEREAGVGYGIADVATDEEIHLTAFTVVDASINPDVTLVRHGTLIYENKIPGWADMTADQKTAIRTRYQCITAVS